MMFRRTSPDRRRMIAIHEAGHAVAGDLLGLKVIRIARPVGYGREAVAVFESQGPDDSRESLQAWIRVCVAGQVAAERLSAAQEPSVTAGVDPSEGTGRDYAIAREYAGRLGDSEQQIDAARHDVNRMFMRSNTWETVEAIASMLVEHDEVTTEQLQAALTQARVQQPG